MNQSRLTPPERDPMVGRPNTPVTPFRRDAVGGSAPVLSHIVGRDGSPMFSLSPFQSSSPVKNISGRESVSSSGRSQTPQRTIKPIRETPPMRAPLATSVSNPKLRTNSSTHLSEQQFFPYMPSKSYGAIDEQHIYDGVDVDLCNPSGLIRPEPCKDPVPKCESLSKSSSDGDHIHNKKKVLTKAKNRRRNVIVSGTPTTGVVSDDSINRADIEGKVRQGCYGGSSSDDNRYSAQGMSDNHRSSYISSSPTYDNTMKLAQLLNCEKVPNVTPSAHNNQCISGNTRHSNLRRSGLKSRKREQKSIFHKQGIGSQLEGVRAAIEQMSFKAQGSHSTSTYSSNFSSSDYSSANPSLRRLIRHSSLETIGTNITSAGDEFVWIDSDSRLVELQHYPWTNGDVLRLLQQGRLKNQLMRISMECVPRLSRLLQRPLIRIACEAQRFSKTLGLCTRHEVCGAIKVVLSGSLADSSIKCGHRAAAIFAVSGPDNYRQSKSVRAGLCLSLGKFHRWMCDMRMGQFIDEYAAIYLLSAMENLFEEIIVECLSMQIESTDYILSATLLDSCIANNSDFWGLLQPFAHLNSGRTATGMLSLPSLYFQTNVSESTAIGGDPNTQTNPQYFATKTLEQQLLTTCVGSVKELGEIIDNVSRHRVANRDSVPNGCANWWSTYGFDMSGLQSLYYYMRCTQLEHNSSDDQLIQRSEQLIKERSYVVLPPLYEWMRVSAAHAYYRRSNIIDQNDVLQAARILLPGIDCPPRQPININNEDWIYERKDVDPNECTRRMKMWLAFRMLSVGRTDLISSALQLLPNNYGLNAVNDSGLTILMQSCIVGDNKLVECLCESGANVNIEAPVVKNARNKSRNQLISETQHWTALNYATINGHIDCVKILLEKSANVDGGYRYGEDRVTITPLQLAASSGRIDIVRLLLSYGADPFLQTTQNDSIATHSSSFKGCPSAISVAAIHGHRMALRTLLAHPTALADTRKDRLSLEEMLAESSANYNSLCANKDRTVGAQGGNDTSNVIQWTKSKIRALQEAMYHSAENENIEITLDLSNIGVPWTLHTWMQTVATAHEMRLEAITDQLLQDFLHLWPDDCSHQFIDECLPLLFSIFRHSKHNSTTALLLADIFSTCFGSCGVKPLTTKVSDIGCFARIDPKYVNNREMSDCVFRVENRVFYAHKIILVNASKRFQSMLSTNNYTNCDHNSNGSQTLNTIMTPIVIDNIRYDIFLKVMQFLYNGGFDEDFEVEEKDILELLSAAAYFELEGLVRYCSVRCSQCVTLDNVMSFYMNAIRYKASDLRQFCQTFVLHNLVPLLSYESPLAELLFKTKADNTRSHDLLSALLFTLQNAIRVRQTPPKNHYNMKSNKNLSVL